MRRRRARGRTRSADLLVATRARSSRDGRSDASRMLPTSGCATLPLGARAPGAMTTLLIDNHDSNTFNLFQLLALIEGELPEVIRNDEADWSALDVERFSKVVI